MAAGYTHKDASGCGVIGLLIFASVIGWVFGEEKGRMDGLKLGGQLVSQCERNFEKRGYISIAECFENEVNEIRDERWAEAAANQPN